MPFIRSDGLARACALWHILAMKSRSSSLRRGLLGLLAVLALLAPVPASGGMECGENLSPADRVHCENLLLDAVDTELNRVYREALGVLDSRGAELLRAAQRAWLAYRDHNFETFAAAGPAQGQAGLAERVRDLRLLTSSRTRELERLLALARSEAADSAALVPGPAGTLPGLPGTGPDGPPGEAPPPPALPLPPDDTPAPPLEPLPPDAPEPLPTPLTAVADAPAAASLAGRHPLRLQWLSGVPPGTAEIVERDGVLWLTGRQGQGANMLLVEGHLAAVEADAFVLRGRVVTRVDFLGGGQPCERKGDLLFARKAGRPFWRLQAIVNPCTGVSDYVDIAVEHEP